MADCRLLARKPIPTPTTRSTTTCVTTRRTRTSRHGRTVACCSPNEELVTSKGGSAPGRTWVRPGAHEPAVAVLPIGRRVEEPAVGPQGVRPALELERCARTEMTVIDLAVVAHRRDHGHDPVGLEAEALAELRVLGAEQTLDHRVVAASGHVLDVVLGDALLLRLEGGEDDPLHDVEPGVVAERHDGPQRLLRHHVVEDDVLIGGAQRGA